jgi:hypothetical protein
MQEDCGTIGIVEGDQYGRTVVEISHTQQLQGVCVEYADLLLNRGSETHYKDATHAHSTSHQKISSLNKDKKGNVLPIPDSCHALYISPENLLIKAKQK